MKIAKTHFGKTKEGAEVELFTLLNDNQVTVKITEPSLLRSRPRTRMEK
jgi:hypothetical protein